MRLSPDDELRVSLDAPWPPHKSLRAALLHEKERTRIGAVRLLNQATDTPGGLTPKIIQKWFDRRSHSARRDYAEYVMSRWSSFPTIDVVEITPAIRKSLNEHARRTGVGCKALISGQTALPDRLTSSILDSWVDGRAKTARRAHLKFVLSAWSVLPNAPYVPITPAILKELKGLRRESGFGPNAILSKCPDKPEGLTAKTVSTWLEGAAKSARQHHLSFVLNRWRNMPKRVAITPDQRAYLKAQALRTGLGATAFVRVCTDPPKELNAPMILGWINGTRKHAQEDHLEFVMEAWSALPDSGGETPVKGRRTAGYRILTEGDIAALHAERKRTGIGVSGLLRLCANLPEGLNAAAVQHWLSRRVMSAPPGCYEFLLERWRLLPDGVSRKRFDSARHSRSTVSAHTGREKFIPITDAMRRALCTERKRTGITAGKLLRAADKPPSDLKEYTINAWLSGAVKSGDAGHIHFVLGRWRALPSRKNKNDS